MKLNKAGERQVLDRQNGVMAYMKKKLRQDGVHEAAGILSS